MIFTLLFASFLVISVFHEIEMQIKDSTDFNWQKAVQFSNVRNSFAFIAALTIFGILSGLEILLTVKGVVGVGNALDVLIRLVLYLGLATLAIYYKYLDVLQKMALASTTKVSPIKRKKLLTLAMAVIIFIAFLFRQIRHLI